MIKPVIQEETTGCAIASVAAIAGVSYRNAKAAARRLGIEAADDRLWSDTAHVRKLLAHFKIASASTKVPFRSWTALPDLALLATKWHVHQGRAFWHWVVFVRIKGSPQVLDSKRRLRRHRRTDFGRMRPKWYLRVRHKENF